MCISLWFLSYHVLTILEYLLDRFRLSRLTGLSEYRPSPNLLFSLNPVYSRIGAPSRRKNNALRLVFFYLCIFFRNHATELAISCLFLPSPRPAKQLGLETSFKSIQFLSSSSGRECAAWCTRTNQRTGMRRIGPDVCVRFRNAGGAVRRYATRNGGSERAQMARDLSVNLEGGGGQ